MIEVPEISQPPTREVVSEEYPSSRWSSIRPAAQEIDHADASSQYFAQSKQQSPIPARNVQHTTSNDHRPPEPKEHVICTTSESSASTLRYEGERVQEVPSTSKKNSYRSVSEDRSSDLTTTSTEEFVVFIPELPTGDSQTRLEETIRFRLSNTHHLAITNVRCYMDIGLGVVKLANRDDQDLLVQSHESIVLDPRAGTTIRFVTELSLDSYLVLETTKKSDITSQDIAQRWQILSRSSQPTRCEVVSDQFPNVFKLIFHSLDELLAAQSIDVFAIQSHPVRVYLRAECSFLEDLPIYLDESKLRDAITAQTGRQCDATSLYIQYNRGTSSALILSTQKAGKWSHIALDNQSCGKQTRLSYRLAIQPYPHHLSLDDLSKHPLFSNAAVPRKRQGDRVILEIDDRSIYESALQRGMIIMNQQHLHITAFTDVLNNPEAIEITAQNWYESAMLTHEPELKQFLASPSTQEIFKYQWNAQQWIDQMTRWEGIKDTDGDKKRRLLRVTAMVNTIGVLSRQAYRTNIDGQETEVKLICPRAQSIVYSHRSKLNKSQELSTPLRPPFPSTNVFVVNEDCLVVYERMAAKNCSPVLLNMANAETPGGGYQRGAGAQEENIFRRSNYYLSLDAELDTKKQADRFWCTENGEKKPVDDGQKFYPIAEFGAIYTSDLTVFRHSEDKGYAFLDRPVSGVCAIAVAAYDRRNHRGTVENVLEDKLAVGTRKKIENLFAVAHHHKHDCLILSALGCGAFRNPPQHVAAIFQSVIEQYAGYFREIYFSIIDDHNTGQRSNPHGNFQPFQSILNGFIASPPERELEINMTSGPFRIVTKNQGKIGLDQVKIFDLHPCQYGALCHDLNDPQHRTTYSHPGLCPVYETCTRSKATGDVVHASSFIHRSPCSYGGSCREIRDPVHQRKFDHPELCSVGGHCRDMDKTHLTKYSHVPLCRDGLQCPLNARYDAKHCHDFRHCQHGCPHADHCADFHDPTHVANLAHPFPPPCPLTPYACRLHQDHLQKKTSRDIEEHCRRYSHVCPWGRLCNDTSREHRGSSIHIARCLCPHKDRCSKLDDEEHLNSFTHLTKPDIRYLCHYAGPECRDREKADHIARFRHTGNYKHIGVAPYFRLNDRINFVRNHNKLIDNVDTYTQKEKWSASKHPFDEVIDWIRALPPVHRCEKAIFESILVHGHVMSRTYMDRLGKSAFVADAVGQHPHVRRILDRHNNPALTHAAKGFIHALVSIEFAKSYTGNSRMGDLGIFGASGDLGAPAHPTDDTETHKKTINVTESQLKALLSVGEIGEIREHAKRIADASLRLQRDKAGIGHGQDESFGTNNHIFSVLGPHRGHYYGDIFIVFRREIMHHPDANFSIQAATSYGQSASAYQKRPWLKDPGASAHRVQHFHWNKLHCSVPGWEDAAAQELIALTGLLKKSMHVKLDDVQKRWMHIDSHDTFEAHLPQLVPLDYIDHVYMAKNVFASLSQTSRDVARKTFGDRLTITEHVVELSASKQLDATHASYQDHVLKEINKKIVSNHARFHHGTTITMSPSDFKEYITIPMTISQSFHLPQTKKDAEETVFIYWKAIGGDMMLALSKEEINAGKGQSSDRCLLCYIAETPMADSSEDYRESYSYLTAGFPYSHGMLARNSNFTAKSNSFHRGCNVDDYITYCLIIKRKTGQVILSHVGSNNIYNHQSIEHNFQRSELDLSTLDYVQISARERTVPVRDLVIRHEPIKEYHVTFDKDFKGNNEASKPSRATTDGSSAAPQDDSPSILGSALNYVKDKIFGKDDSPLPPCDDSVNCLLQHSSSESKAHNAKYSHPCRFSELCRSKSDHPHLEHIPHPVSMCTYDDKCRDLGDPLHRAKFRHTDLPDFLFPCRDQKDCRNRSHEHRVKYSHGEDVFALKAEATTATSSSDDRRRPPSTEDRHRPAPKKHDNA